MKIAMVTSVSDCTPWAEFTTPNHSEYCKRNGYTFIARHLPYTEAVGDFAFLLDLLSHFDAVWALDSDAVVTNMSYKVESILAYDGNSMHVCREQISDLVRINCGSVIWTPGCKRLIQSLVDHEAEWRSLTWIWQQWVEQLFYGERQVTGIDARSCITVHPSRTFNSCDHGDVQNWMSGDFVFHPCGEALDRKMASIKFVIEGSVIR
ncbi:hypothetical protein UFOVP898_10 [uncultured Caudovirales phage]|uniref:Nucleotide-diphospho-sugar transferase domain-containing protein n=1 Tax=uncultured Caudovirales phage TaxID=2100421 RepID=A0A6J5RZZ3_9CAUD|nr:hypothetical protein UFOVP898_10 [uncultured Caudovirales phage]CAB4176665.1 hypothetical protein UFOVP985_49 [uncultured Caudovirales phage]CAB4181061.1 hypothetical protein UFOVP1073_8 [uncultured Caudovirales phage]CAB4198055.1 hypothetical protein UFOVP1308_47 [uncultured Caudovirales phage]CAB4210485.1 hypothetical protein UFOVP1423_22 [uncultured Caudovirales phage]